jgi:uncharacterized delta-60 repeat protein
MALQPDGKILLIGHSFKNRTINELKNLVAIRLRSDGTVDAGFGNNGYVVHDYGDFEYRATEVAIQPDGKIVMGGPTESGVNFDFALWRWNNDGSRDFSFGKESMLITDFGGNDQIEDITLQPDGKILAAGSTYAPAGGYRSMVIVRYTADGSLDKSFSSDGILTQKLLSFLGSLPPRLESSDRAKAIIVQEDGKILVAAETIASNNVFSRSFFAVVRYQPDGELDVSFNNDGVQTTSGLLGFRTPFLALQMDGKIIISGNIGIGLTEIRTLALFRYQTNGVLDSDFNGDGMAVLDLPIRYGSRTFNSVALQPGGKIVTAGINGVVGSNDMLVERYNADGSHDSTFGNNGVVTNNIADGDDIAQSVVVQKDGKIVVAGYTRRDVNNNYDMVLLRYNNDGSLDEGFGNSGTVVTDFGGDEFASSMAITDDGKIVVGGTSRTTNNSFIIARYHSNGLLDESFGNNGMTITDFGGDSFLKDLVLQKDGRIIAAGYVISAPGNYDFALASYNPDGSLDQSFSGDGKQVTDFSSLNDLATTVALQSDGRIIVGGYSQSLSGQDFIIARYTANGVLDQGFDTDGKQLVDFYLLDYVSSIEIQTNDKIIVAGYGYRDNNSNADILLARLNSNGSLDQLFGNSGKLTTDLGSSEIANSISIDSNRLYLAGSVSVESGQTTQLNYKSLIAAYQLEGPEPIVTVNDAVASIQQLQSVLTVSLSQPSIQSQVFSYKTIDGTAKQGQDYFKQQGTVIFQPGETSKTITIRLNKNKKKEITEYFDVQLYAVNVTNDLILQDLSGRITIEAGNNQNHRLAEEPLQNFSVTIAPNPTTYSFRLYFSGSIPDKQSIRILDGSGKVIETKFIQGSNSIMVGQDYPWWNLLC